MARISRTEQQARTRAALIDAARTHFSDDGYAVASLDRIADDAGYTRGAIYANFDGKAGLFLAVLDVRLQAQVKDLESIGGDLSGIRGWRLATAEEQRGLALAVLEFRVIALRDDNLRVQLRERQRAVRQAFATVVTRNAKEFGVELPMPAEDLATVLLALGDGLTEQHLLDPERVDSGLFEALLAILIGNAAPAVDR